MIDYIVYGEFDINEGNVIKVEYPNKTGVNEMILASYLIPEGTHNIMNDSFCFVINKKPNPEEIMIENSKKQMEKLNLNFIRYLDLNSSSTYKEIQSNSFKLKEMYNYNTFNSNWESLKIAENLSQTNNVYFKLSLDEKEKFYNMIIFDFKTNEIFFKIPVHNDIQFKKLNSNFASIYTLNSQAVGFDFENEDELKNLEKLFESEQMDILTNRKDELEYSMSIINDYNTILNSEKEIYFLCYLETRLDKSTKRGAILKSISVGTTKLINLQIFKPLCKFMLEEIFRIYTFNVKDEEKMNLIKKLIDLSYRSFNSLPTKNLCPNNSIRILNAFLQSSNYFYLDNINSMELEIGNNKIYLDTQIADAEEKIFPGLLTDLIKTFKENTMLIYDAILTDRKILFVGDANTSCEKLSCYIFSILNMVSNNVLGVLKRIHPYKNLYDLEFLKSLNCIYAVTNPIFKNKTDCWDLMCEVDTGKITMSENYKKYLQTINRDSDLFFIKELLYKIKNEFITEYEVCRYFKIYTSHLMRITGELYFSDDDELTNEINKQYKRKLKIQSSSIFKMYIELDKFKEYVNANGRSFKLIQRHLDFLYNRKNIEKEELMLIYSDILKFVDNEIYIYMVK